MRALASSGSPAPVRAMQIARGMPRAAREFEGHITAFCEVAQMLTDRLGLPASMQGLFAYLIERWDGKGAARSGQARGDPAAGADRLSGPRRRLPAHARRRGVRRPGGPQSGRAARSIRPSPSALADEAAELLALDADGSAWEETLAREPGAAVDPGGRGDRPGAGGDGRLRRPCLAVPGRPLGRRRRAGHGGGAAVPVSTAADLVTVRRGGAACTTSGASRSRSASGRRPRR